MKVIQDELNTVMSNKSKRTLYRTQKSNQKITLNFNYNQLMQRSQSVQKRSPINNTLVKTPTLQKTPNNNTLQKTPNNSTLQKTIKLIDNQTFWKGDNKKRTNINLLTDKGEFIKTKKHKNLYLPIGKLFKKAKQRSFTVQNYPSTKDKSSSTQKRLLRANSTQTCKSFKSINIEDKRIKKIKFLKDKEEHYDSSDNTIMTIVQGKHQFQQTKNKNSKIHLLKRQNNLQNIVIQYNHRKYRQKLKINSKQYSLNLRITNFNRKTQNQLEQIQTFNKKIQQISSINKTNQHKYSSLNQQSNFSQVKTIQPVQINKNLIKQLGEKIDFTTTNNYKTNQRIKQASNNLISPIAQNDVQLNFKSQLVTQRKQNPINHQNKILDYNIDYQIDSIVTLNPIQKDQIITNTIQKNKIITKSQKDVIDEQKIDCSIKANSKPKQQKVSKRSPKKTLKKIALQKQTQIQDIQQMIVKKQFVQKCIKKQQQTNQLDIDNRLKLLSQRKSQLSFIICTGQVASYCSQLMPKKNLSWYIPSLLLYRYCYKFHQDLIPLFEKSFQHKLIHHEEFQNFVMEFQLLRANLNKIYQKCKKKKLVKMEVDQFMNRNVQNVRHNHQFFLLLISQVQLFVQPLLKAQSLTITDQRMHELTCAVRVILALLKALKMEFIILKKQNAHKYQNLVVIDNVQVQSLTQKQAQKKLNQIYHYMQKVVQKFKNLIFEK